MSAKVVAHIVMGKLKSGHTPKFIAHGKICEARKVAS